MRCDRGSPNRNDVNSAARFSSARQRACLRGRSCPRFATRNKLSIMLTLAMTCHLADTCTPVLLRSVRALRTAACTVAVPSRAKRWRVRCLAYSCAARTALRRARLLARLAVPQRCRCASHGRSCSFTPHLRSRAPPTSSRALRCRRCSSTARLAPRAFRHAPFRSCRAPALSTNRAGSRAAAFAQGPACGVAAGRAAQGC